MNLELIDIFDEPSRVENIWKSLATEGARSYFLSWGWIENWLASLPRQVPIKLAVLKEGDEPVCAFFLGRAKVANQKVFRSRALLLNQTGCWAYDRLYIEGNSVVCKGTPACSLQQIVDALPGDWEEFYLSALDPSSFPGNALSSLTGRNELMIARVLPCPYVDLQLVRDKGGNYPAVLRSNIRAQIRRTVRIYETQAPIVTEMAHDVASAMDIYRELIDLHQASWTTRKKDGAFATEYFREFHRKLIEKRIHSGEIQLLRVRCAGKTIGCLYNFVFRGTVYFYQSGLAYSDDNRVKPGYVCHAEAIRLSAETGADAYDFMAGSDEYKQRLATHQRSMIWARVQKPKLKFRIERLARRAAIDGLALYRKWKSGKRTGVTVPAGNEA
ncbi:MAG: GNAT family N-acetyltransferase [Candidatus Solibacter sp.]